jgi:hypothetical protein
LHGSTSKSLQILLHVQFATAENRSLCQSSQFLENFKGKRQQKTLEIALENHVECVMNDLMVQASVTQIVQRKSTLSIIVRYVWGCFTTRIKGVFNPTAMPVFYYLPATYCSQGSTRVHTFKLPLRFTCTSTKIRMHQHSSSLKSLCQSRVTLTLS